MDEQRKAEIRERYADPLWLRIAHRMWIHTRVDAWLGVAFLLAFAAIIGMMLVVMLFRH